MEEDIIKFLDKYGIPFNPMSSMSLSFRLEEESDDIIGVSIAFSFPSNKLFMNHDLKYFRRLTSK